LPFSFQENDDDDMISVLIGILSLLVLEINNVEANDDDRRGQGCVDLSTFEGQNVPAGIEDKHHSYRSIYDIIDS